jgi:hypothetical protein
LEVLVSLAKREQSRLKTWVKLSQTGIIALAQQVETEAGHFVEVVVRLHAGQAKRRPAFESAQITRTAQKLCDHVVGFALWRPVERALGR